MRNVKRLCAVVSLVVACGASLIGCGGDDATGPMPSTSGAGGANPADASKAGAGGSGGSRAGSAGTAGSAGSVIGGAAGNPGPDSGASDTGVGETSTEASADVSVRDSQPDVSAADGPSSDVARDSDAGPSNDRAVSDGPGPDGLSANDSSPDAATTDAGAEGSTCVVGSMCAFGDAGGNGVLDGSCTCQGCASTDALGDTQCQGAYGAGYLCLLIGGSRTCTPGNCRSTNGAAPACTGGEICANSTCAPCATTNDCTAGGAYGAGYVCATGACVQGNCVTSVDCDVDGGGSAGQLCGANNNCGQCTRDDQCAADAHYSAAGRTLCDTTTHTCVGTSCAGAGPGACAGTHVCCGGVCQPNTTFSSAVGPGKSCCGASDCAGTGANSCTQSVCSACPAVQKNPVAGSAGTYDFVVDPADATADGGPVSDVGRSGADQTGCRFHTLTYAIAFAGTYPNVGPATPARVLLRRDASPSEQYPLNVPSNVSVVGDSGTRPALKIPAATEGVHLFASNSGLSKLLIDGVSGNVLSNQRYSRGIVVQGAGLSNVSIDHVTVQNSRLEGIVVGGANGVGGTLAINSGVVVQGSGYIGGTNNPPPSSGVLVLGTGSVTITGGADQIALSQNVQHGVSVTQAGSVTVNATVDVTNPTAAGYDGAPIVAIANGAAGLSIAQTAVGAANGTSTVPVNNVTGFVSLRTTAGNGFRIEGGSKAKLRNCVTYGNALSGILVTTSAQAGATAVDRNWTGNIDLGTSGSSGNNVVQVPGQPFGVTPPTGELPNGRAGICLGIATGSAQTLSALGNIMVQTTNQEVFCASASIGTPVVLGAPNCRSAPSTITTIGIPSSVGFTNQGTNAIDATRCVGQ
jgi:hypothetical protein